MPVAYTHFLLAYFLFFFFNDPAPTEIYTLSLHDALPICPSIRRSVDPLSDYSRRERSRRDSSIIRVGESRRDRDRKSTRLNSSHITISYAVFCLKKKKITIVRYDEVQFFILSACHSL